MSIESEQGQDDCDNYGCQLALAIKKYNTAAKNYQDLAKDFMLAESIRDGINMDINRVQSTIEQSIAHANVCTFYRYDINVLAYDFQGTKKSLRQLYDLVSIMGQNVLKIFNKYKKHITSDNKIISLKNHMQAY